MDEKDWGIFQLVAREKNLTKASKKLYLSQPAITSRIKNLEKEFKAQFVLRTPNGIALTPAGETFLAYIDRLEDITTTFRDQLLNNEKLVQGTLRLGCFAMFAHYELPSILQLFCAKYPLVNLDIKASYSTNIYQMLQEGQLATAILHGNHLWASGKIFLYEEPLCVAYHTPVKLDELQDLPYLLYKTDPIFAEMINQWYKQNLKYQSQKIIKVDSFATCIQFIKKALVGQYYPMLA